MNLIYREHPEFTPALRVYRNRCSMAIAMQDPFPTGSEPRLKQPTSHIPIGLFRSKEAKGRIGDSSATQEGKGMTSLEQTPVKFSGKTLKQMHACNAVSFPIQSRTYKTDAKLAWNQSQNSTRHSTLGRQPDLNREFA